MADDSFLPPVEAKLEGSDDGFAAMVDRALADLDRLKESVDEFGRKDDRAKVGVNGEEEVKRQLDDLDARLDEYGRKREDAHVGVSGGEGLGALASSIMLFGPALIPILTEAVALTVALAGGLTAAGVGAGAFAAVAYPAIKEVVTATGDLSGEAGVAQTAWRNLTSDWDSFVKSFQPEVFRAMAGGVNDLDQLLPGLRPLIAAAGDAIIGLEHDAEHAFNSPVWKGFLDWFGKQSGPAITDWGKTAGNILTGVLALFKDFTPLIDAVDSHLVSGSAGFAKWAEGLDKTEGFKEFLHYTETEAPKVEQFISELVDDLIDIGRAAAPIGDEMLSGVDAFLHTLGHFADAHPDIVKTAIALTAVAGGAGLLGKALGPLQSALGFLVAEPEIAAVIAIGVGFYEAYEHIKPFHDAVNRVAGHLRGDVGPAMHWISAVVLPELAKEFGGTGREIESDFHQFLGGAVAWAKGEMDAFQGWWANNGQDIEEAAERIWTAIATDINIQIRAMLAIAKAVMPDIKEVVTDTFRVIGDLVAVAADVIDGHWSKAVTNLEKLSKDGTDLMTAPFRVFGPEVGGIMLHAGEHIVESLAQGMKDEAESVISEAKSLADKVLSFFPHSPAKDGPLKDHPPEQWGASIAKGLASGIEAHKAEAAAAARDLAQATYGPFALFGFDARASKDRNRFVGIGLGAQRAVQGDHPGRLREERHRDDELIKHLQKLSRETRGLPIHDQVVEELLDAIKEHTVITRDLLRVEATLAARANARALASAHQNVGNDASYLALETGVHNGAPQIVVHQHIRGSVMAEKQLYRAVQVRALRRERHGQTNGLTRRK